MQMPKLESERCSYKPSLGAERQSLGDWQERTWTPRWEKEGADLDRRAEVGGLPTPMANCCYCVRGSQVRVRTYPAEEKVGSTNLDPKAVALHSSPSRMVFLLSLVVASSHWAYRAADLEWLRQHRSGQLWD